MVRVFRGILLAAGILALTAGSAQAQGVGQIFGKVTDQSGGVMPGVTVTVSGPTLQAPLVAVTTETGAYQFPTVPIGTFTVTFELASFKKSVRPNVIITTGFSAQIDQKLELGQMSEELTVTAATPVVDTKKTATGSVFTKDIFENIPTARDPQQVINMTPGVQLNGYNVGGSASGQQLLPSVYGSGGSVQWNLEGGSITDLSSNSSAAYYNFDSFEQIQVVSGGGDVSVQSGGLSINLVTKSGSNMFKGSAVGTFENDAMQGVNVTPELFSTGSGFLSGNPLTKITNASIEYGGPIKRNRLWWWAMADHQDINVGVINFFDATKGDYCQQLVSAQRTGSTALASQITYDKLQDVQNCLANDKTLIKNLGWKVNYQLNTSNKFQYLFQSDNKFRNARGASANTAKEATTEQTSDKPMGFPLPIHSLTHTYIATDKLVFNNMYSYVHGGFFLDYQGSFSQGICEGMSRYLGITNYNDYLTGDRANPDCLFNQQQLLNRTTSFQQRSLLGSYQTNRHGHELKSDGTYFLSNMVGGDHSLKFGLGWRRNPVQSFSHYSGGARAQVQCAGNNRNNCGSGQMVPVGSATGLVPYQAILYRDRLINNAWWSYNGYIQDSYSRGRLRINGGLRYDWQTSKYLGGCVPNNPLRPDLLPSQCENATDVDPVSKKKIQSFSNVSPRVSVIYDLTGTGKTSIRASYSYYFATRIVLANALGALNEQPALTWGNNQNSGACSTTAGAPCWTDANMDGWVQVNELLGTPTSNNSRFNLDTGQLTPAGNTVDPSTKIGRTREVITGLQHELMPNLAIGTEYVYRIYDRGTAAYNLGYQPGAPGYPYSQIYSDRQIWTDTTTGLSAPYYTPCQGCVRATGLASITMTNPRYQVYHGLSTTLNKRFSNRWQANGSVTWQTNPSYIPIGEGALFNGNGGSDNNPTGIEFLDGRSTLARYLVKLNGSYSLPWQINVSGNLNVTDGENRTVSITGPGTVYGGVSPAGAATTISYNTLTFQPAGTTRLEPVKLLDLAVHKIFNFNGGRNRLRLMFDAFNVFNINTATNFSSNTMGNANFASASAIIPPRVFRVGAQVAF